jgi:large subunit ribosomal protein L10
LAITKERKELLLAKYTELLEKSEAIFLADYTGLSVKGMEGLRKEVRAANGVFHVTKNTILDLALKQADKPSSSELLTGQLATGFALEEAPSLAKTLVDFAKKEESFSLKGAVMGNELLTTAQVESLASLPSLDQLRGQIVGLISAPAQGLATAMAAGLRQVVNVVDAYAKSEDAPEAA